MAELEKVVQGLQHCFNAKCEGCSYGNTESGHYACKKHEMLGDALELLNAKEPRVMTLYEASECSGKAIYIEEDRIDKPIKAGLVLQTIVYEDKRNGKELDRLFYIEILGECKIEKLLEYGSYWRCWTARPTDEQRKAVKWDGEA